MRWPEFRQTLESVGWSAINPSLTTGFADGGRVIYRRWEVEATDRDGRAVHESMEDMPGIWERFLGAMT